MDSYHFLGWVGILILSGIALYVVVRLASAAFFRSLHEYNERKSNEQQKRT